MITMQSFSIASVFSKKILVETSVVSIIHGYSILLNHIIFFAFEG